MYFAGQGDSSIERNAIAIQHPFEATAEVDVATARNRELGSVYPLAVASPFPYRVRPAQGSPGACKPCGCAHMSRVGFFIVRPALPRASSAGPAPRSVSLFDPPPLRAAVTSCL